jgi:hypothetical protein
MNTKVGFIEIVLMMGDGCNSAHWRIDISGFYYKTVCAKLAQATDGNPRDW